MHHRQNWRRAALGCLAVALVAASAAAAPVTYEFRVFDPAHNPVDEIVMYDSNAVPARMAARIGGIFEVVGEPNDRFLVTAQADTLRLGSGLKSPLVLPDNNGVLIDVHLVAPGGAPGGGNVAGADCENATVITSLPYNDSSSTLGSNDTLPGAACDGANNWGGPVGWYTVDGTGNTMTAETCASSTDTTLSVWLSCGEDGCNNLECVAGGEDDCGPGLPFSSQAVWPSVDGQPYVIAVQGFAGANVSFTLDVFDDGTEASGQILCTGGCCTCLNEPFNCQVENNPHCDALGGDYVGDGTACCAGDGTFTDLDVGGLPVPLPDVTTTLATATSAETALTLDVDVQIDLTHTFIGDFQMNVLHAGGDEDIWDNRCGSWDNMRSTADDEGTETFCTVVGLGPSEDVHYAQQIASFGNLDNYACAAQLGDWTLSLADQFGGDSGNLEAVQFEFDNASGVCEAGPTGDCDDGKADICHVPPGNPGNAHVISIGQPAVPSHIANHGDCDPPAGAVKGDPCSCP